MLRTYTKFAKETTKTEAISALTNAMTKNQISNKPVHEWEIPNLEDFMDYEAGEVTVEEFMETDIFTVQQDDILGLVSDIMNWSDLRYIAVEDDKGQLIGLVSSNTVINQFLKKPKEQDLQELLVKDVMIPNPITIEPKATFMDAMKLIEKHQINCLPVVRETGELVGMITETTFFKMSKRLLQKMQ
jgi:CBS domain-containing protein